MDVKANFRNLHTNGTDSNFTIETFSKVLYEEDDDFFKGSGDLFFFSLHKAISVGNVTNLCTQRNPSYSFTIKETVVSICLTLYDYTAPDQF